jgi:hypothetical protein
MVESGHCGNDSTVALPTQFGETIQIDRTCRLQPSGLAARNCESLALPKVAAVCSPTGPPPSRQALSGVHHPILGMAVTCLWVSCSGCQIPS